MFSHSITSSKQSIRLTWRPTIERISILLICSSAKCFGAILRCFSVQNRSLLLLLSTRNIYLTEFVRWRIYMTVMTSLHMNQSENRFIQKYASPFHHYRVPALSMCCTKFVNLNLCSCLRLPSAYPLWSTHSTHRHCGIGVYRLDVGYSDTGYNSKRPHVRQKRTEDGTAAAATRPQKHFRARFMNEIDVASFWRFARANIMYTSLTWDSVAVSVRVCVRVLVLSAWWEYIGKAFLSNINSMMKHERIHIDATENETMRKITFIHRKQFQLRTQCETIKLTKNRHFWWQRLCVCLLERKKTTKCGWVCIENWNSEIVKWCYRHLKIWNDEFKIMFLKSEISTVGKNIVQLSVDNGWTWRQVCELSAGKMLHPTQSSNSSSC